MHVWVKNIFNYLQPTVSFLDRATIKYRLVMNCLDGSCKMEMYNISYFHGDNKEMEAEDWITDEAGLNKAKTKVVAKYGKLRIKTIDLFDGLTEKAAKALGGTEVLVPLIAKEPKVVPGEFSREIPGLLRTVPWQATDASLRIRSRAISLRCFLRTGC